MASFCIYDDFNVWLGVPCSLLLLVLYCFLGSQALPFTICTFSKLTIVEFLFVNENAILFFSCSQCL